MNAPYYLKNGLTEQEKHRILLNVIFNPSGIKILPSTDYQDKCLGIDHIWQRISDGVIIDYTDFKTKSTEKKQEYCLTSYTNKFHQYVFKKTRSSKYIFLLENYYWFIQIKDIQKWYEDRHSFIDDYDRCGDWPSIQSGNDSKYYKFPLEAVKNLCFKKISFSHLLKS
jgi:hypothetical protein